MPIVYILWSFCLFSPTFGMLYKEKSGNPAIKPVLYIDEGWTCHYNRLNGSHDPSHALCTYMCEQDILMLLK
jgi:hypothetical protein